MEQKDKRKKALSSIIRTIVRWSEAHGGRLTMARYRSDVKKRRGSYSHRDLERHWRKYGGKPREQKVEERQVSAIKEAKKSVSIWQKVKNFLRGKR